MARRRDPLIVKLFDPSISLKRIEKCLRFLRTCLIPVTAFCILGLFVRITIYVGVSGGEYYLSLKQDAGLTVMLILGLLAVLVSLSLTRRSMNRPTGVEIA